MESSTELQLERELAELLYPHARMSYDENGNYWYMNHATEPSPNFLGYVPKWARDGAASFELMVLTSSFPVRVSGGIAIMDELGRERIVEEMFYDHVGGERDIGTDEETSWIQTTRIAILRAAIYKEKLKKKKA